MFEQILKWGRLCRSLLLTWPKVEKIRTDLFMSEDMVRVNCDAMSLRGFVTYMVKRHDGSVRRELCLCQLVLIFLWEFFPQNPAAMKVPCFLC